MCISPRALVLRPKQIHRRKAEQSPGFLLGTLSTSVFLILILFYLVLVLVYFLY